MKTKKRMILIIGVLLAFIAAASSFKACLAPAKQGAFQFESLKKGDVANTVNSTGTLSAVQTVEVGSQVSGIVRKVLVDYNDEVKQNQVLAILDKTLFEVAIRDAQAGVNRARAKLNQANTELKRNQTLYQKGHISEIEFLGIETSAEIAKADLETAQAALNRAQTNLDYTVICSPIHGTVIERSVEGGQTIAASFQSPKLFVIAEDLTRMQIEASVDESDIGQIKKGLTVSFEVQAYPDKNFNGIVRQIRLQPTTIQNVVNYTVVVDASNENGLLLPGMTASVDFLVEKKRGVLLVPNTALSFKPSSELIKKYGQQLALETLPEEKGQVFFLDQNGTPTKVIIEKGTTDGKFTEIIGSSGLKEGQKLITAYKADGKSNSETKHSSLLPPPPGN
jgi:HlyD family secretion protein